MKIRFYSGCLPGRYGSVACLTLGTVPLFFPSMAREVELEKRGDELWPFKGLTMDLSHQGLAVRRGEPGSVSSDPFHKSS